MRQADKAARAVVLAVIVTLCPACGSSGDVDSRTPTPRDAAKGTLADETFTAVGTLTLNDSDGVYVGTDASAPGAPCTGSGGYQDIQEGAQVVVTDAAGTTMALGRLEAGQTSDSKSYLSDSYRRCVFTFRVYDVPAGEDFYGIEVASRGVLQKTEAEMRDTGDLSFSLG